MRVASCASRVLDVVEHGDVGRGDHDESGVASQALIAADAVQLLAEVAVWKSG